MVDKSLGNEFTNVICNYIGFRLNKNEPVSLYDVVRDIADTLNWFAGDFKELSEENADDKT